MDADDVILCSLSEAADTAEWYADQVLTAPRGVDADLPPTVVAPR